MDIMEKCATLCNMNKYTPKQLANDCEALLINESGDVQSDAMTLQLFGKLEQVIQKKKSAERATTNPAARGKHTPSSGRQRPAYTTPGDRKVGEKRKSMESSISPSASSADSATLEKGRGLDDEKPTVYSMRKNAGALVASLNTGLGTRGAFQRSAREPLGMRCVLDTSPDGFDNVKGRYRYMYTELEERAHALDQHLEHMEKDIGAKIAVDQVSPIGVPSQDTVWVCGRVCNETSEGKMNATSVMLEGSRKSSAGRAVHLDLKDAPSYALFPGQIVMAQGISANGRRFNVKQLVEGVPRPLATTTPQQLLEFQYSSSYQNGKPLTVVTATGPFTTSDALDYEPLRDLLSNMLSTNPDVVVLMGPFVDIAHPLVQDGDIEIAQEDTGEIEIYSFERLFVEHVCGNIRAFYDEDDDSPTNFVLIPALGDAYHENVYPQPPFGNRDAVKSELFTETLGRLPFPYSKEGSARKRVHLLPNPCMFRINEVLFGATSHDALMSLSSEEIASNVPGDRLVRIASHFIRQQSFSPMFPSPLAASVQLDLRHAKHWTMGKTPDVLILPSKLAPLARNVHGSLVVNPGLMTRGAHGGTYATLNIHPMDQDKLRDMALKTPDDAIPHDVEPRTNVQIVRI